MTRQPMDLNPSSPKDATDQPTKRPLSDAARRALAEAEARRAAYDAKAAEIAREQELNGTKGPEPVRYGDWENKGVASDF